MLVIFALLSLRLRPEDGTSLLRSSFSLLNCVQLDAVESSTLSTDPASCSPASHSEMDLWQIDT